MHEHKRFNKKTNGIFYTQPRCARFLAKRVLSYFETTAKSVRKIAVLDPMVGSGELLLAFCEELLWKLGERQRKKIVKLLPEILYGTDKDQKSIERTKHNLASNLSKATNADLDPDTFSNITRIDALKIGDIEEAFGDVFSRNDPGFPFIIANPPWEVVTINDREFFSIYNPDFRKLSRNERFRRKSVYLQEKKIRHSYNLYKKKIREAKEYIANNYKLGSGFTQINLYRASLERMLQLAKIGGIIGVITPSGLAGEYSSRKIREELLLKNRVLEMWSFSIGSKLFPEADVSPLFTIFFRGGKTGTFIYHSGIDSISSAYELVEQSTPKTDRRFVSKLSPQNFTLTPISNVLEFDILKKLYRFPIISDQTCGDWNIDVGRELDETNDRKYITSEETPYTFLKGRDISPFRISIVRKRWVDKNYPKLERGYHNKERIVWRDIARSNKKRRMFATIAPENYILGNSLNFFKENLTRIQRYYLLGVWSSLTIEYRLRQLSTNNHLNMYVTRQIPVPRLEEDNPYLKEISSVVDQLMKEYSAENVCKLEALVASLYDLTLREFSYVLTRFSKITDKTKSRILEIFESIQIIQNHDTATLSDLDVQMIKSVPEGGNWKDIPESIPSQRLEQIRRNYKLGKGSRSTYYGRLDRKKPAYTISTYFHRPGNGCNIHPTQHRTLSAREAARMQSFPDWFHFFGKSRSSIFKQIGNAVPPLLAYAIAKTIPRGNVIDLFSGAGGMSLGFHLAGHSIITDLELSPDFVKTYSMNIPTESGHVVGDIRSNEIVNELLTKVNNSDEEIHTIIGGPPCQGISEAGNKRSMDDPRNNLYLHFIRIIKLTAPNRFVMENVPGLMTLKRGIFYRRLLNGFRKLDYKITPFTLWAHEFGVPQKRKRIFVVGTKSDAYSPPRSIFSSSSRSNLPRPIPVRDALVNLPQIPHGNWLMKREIQYSEPTSNYVKWLRGRINTEEMLERYSGKKRRSQSPLGDYFQ